MSPPRLVDPDVLDDHLYLHDWSSGVRQSAPRRGDRWTDEREEQLEQLWRQGVPVKDIAAALGPDFTKNMIVSRARLIGLGLHPRKERV